MNIETWLKEQLKAIESDIDDYFNRPIESGLESYDDYIKAKGMGHAYERAIEFLNSRKLSACEHEFSPIRHQHTIYKSCRKCGLIGGI